MPPRKNSKARPRQATRSLRTRKTTLTDLSVSPLINRLPAELLTQVFELSILASAADYENDADNPFLRDHRTVLALVCRSWKDILYGSKLFWTTVDMTRIKSRRLSIANARGASLVVEWDIRTLDGWEKAPKFPVFLLRRLSRAGSMTTLRVVDHCSVLRELDNVTLSPHLGYV